MNKYRLNCFEIANVAALKLEYRTIGVDGPFDGSLADGELTERNLQQMVKRSQFEGKIPVAIERSGDRPLLAIPAEHVLRRREYDLTPDVATLEPHTETKVLELSKTGDPDRIGLSF